jgi:hypothetical protein
MESAMSGGVAWDSRRICFQTYYCNIFLQELIPTGGTTDFYIYTQARIVIGKAVDLGHFDVVMWTRSLMRAGIIFHFLYLSPAHSRCFQSRIPVSPLIK